MKATCECTNSLCSITVDIPFDEACSREEVDLRLIVDGCRRGPEKGDVLVEKRKGYTLYREAASVRMPRLLPSR